jgi:cellulose synthase/poly-beta-1,6-N-acetylglucosamine synthase-like glycosyltransferase
MILTELVLLVWVVLGIVHLGIPLAYFGVMKRVASSRDYGLKMSLEWEPSVSVIVPTYNERPVIEKKLRNLAEMDYPKEKIEIVVVDSASSDGTPEHGRLLEGQASEEPCWRKRRGRVRPRVLTLV